MAAEAALYLDHLTAADATPVELIAAAADAGCAGVCLFLHAMAELPLMPRYDLVADRAARHEVHQALSATGMALGLAYPFTLSRRSVMEDFQPALACAAALGARAVNVLCYDRDPARREDQLGAFCAAARGFGLKVALEFYPASQVPDLAEARRLIAAIGVPGTLGLTVDLLHLMRSGGQPADLAHVPPHEVFFAQLADGPLHLPVADWPEEASAERQFLGAGAFDVAGFRAALPANCPVSVEIPRAADIRAGVPRAERVAAALAGAMA